jgi:hypothetical protein
MLLARQSSYRVEASRPVRIIATGSSRPINLFKTTCRADLAARVELQPLVDASSHRDNHY